MSDDLTPDQAITKLKALPEDKQRAVLTALSPEARKGLLTKLSSSDRPQPGRPLPGSPKGVVYTYRNPKEFLEQTSTQLGEAAQSEAGKTSADIWKNGKYTGARPLLERIGHSLLGGAAETGNIVAKLGSGLMDWKTAGGLLLSKLSPAAGAAFFATQGASGAWEAIKNGQATPENVQNFLLGLSVVVGAGGAGAEGGAGHPVETIKSAARAVKSAARAVPDAVRVVAQESAGAGRGEVQRAVRDRAFNERGRQEQHAANQAEVAKENEAATAAHQQEVAEVTKAHEEKVADLNKAHAEKVETIKKDYADKVGAREKRIAEAEAEHTAKVAKEREEWVRASHEANQMEREAARVEARKEALQSGQEAYGKLIKENVKGVEARVHADLDQQFNNVREQVAEEPATDEQPAVYPELNADVIERRVEKAQEMLQGAPEDIKVFKDLTKRMAHGDAPDDPGTNAHLNWDEGRTQASALGRASASESISGNVRRAIRHVLGDGDAGTGLEGELQRVADERGAGKAYTKARAGWRQYMEDWHDMSSERGGGSPLARLFRAVDDPVVIKQVLSKDFGARLLETYSKYGKWGAAPKLFASLRDFNSEMKVLPKVKVPAKPGPLETSPAPRIPEPVAEPTFPEAPREPKLKVPDAPKPRVAAEPKPLPPTNAFRIRFNRLENFADRPYTFWDFVLPARILEKVMLKFAPVKEWVGSLPRSSDPDFIPKGERLPVNDLGRKTKAAADYVGQLGERGMSATRDYLRGSITRQGYAQRLQVLMPEVEPADIAETVASVDRVRAARMKARTTSRGTPVSPIIPPSQRKQDPVAQTQ